MTVNNDKTKGINHFFDSVNLNKKKRKKKVVKKNPRYSNNTIYPSKANMVKKIFFQLPFNDISSTFTSSSSVLFEMLENIRTNPNSTNTAPDKNGKSPGPG
jgi:hypothetical protein